MPYKSEANFLLAEVGNGSPSDMAYDYYSFLKENNVVIKYMDDIDCNRKIRISIGNEYQMVVLKELTLKYIADIDTEK